MQGGGMRTWRQDVGEGVEENTHMCEYLDILSQYLLQWTLIYKTHVHIHLLDNVKYLTDANLLLQLGIQLYIS